MISYRVSPLQNHATWCQHVLALHATNVHLTSHQEITPQARLVKKAAERNVLEPSYQPVSEPLLLQIGSEHAVALLERTIFDNNHPHGLPLSRESLDYVLQRSRCVEDGFSHVRRAVRLMAGQSVRKAIGKRKRDECNE